MNPEQRLELIALLAQDKAWKTIVLIGEALLNEYYPESMFPGTSGNTGPQYVTNLRALLRELKR